ncbi:MAG: hypothetical protein K6B51_04430 [Bacilli bacterium]|nr:hypothetical protein [Bacilli bacterium]
MKKKIDFCFECYDDVEYEVTEVNKKVKVKDIFLEVKLFEAHCKKCGSLMIVRDLERKNDKIIYDAYKAKKGLMTGKEIVELREKYGLSAVAFAKILGLGEKNVTRYETGAIQTDSVDGYFRMAKNEEEFWKRYKEKRNLLVTKERLQADTKLKEYESLFSPVIVKFDESSVVDDCSFRRKGQVFPNEKRPMVLYRVPLI